MLNLQTAATTKIPQYQAVAVIIISSPGTVLTEVNSARTTRVRPLPVSPRKRRGGVLDKSREHIPRTKNNNNNGSMIYSEKLRGKANRRYGHERWSTKTRRTFVAPHDCKHTVGSRIPHVGMLCIITHEPRRRGKRPALSSSCVRDGDQPIPPGVSRFDFPRERFEHNIQKLIFVLIPTTVSAGDRTHPSRINETSASQVVVYASRYDGIKKKKMFKTGFF